MVPRGKGGARGPEEATGRGSGCGRLIEDLPTIVTFDTHVFGCASISTMRRPGPSR